MAAASEPTLAAIDAATRLDRELRVLTVGHAPENGIDPGEARLLNHTCHREADDPRRVQRVAGRKSIVNTPGRSSDRDALARRRNRSEPGSIVGGRGGGLLGVLTTLPKRGLQSVLIRWMPVVRRRGIR